MSKEKINAEIEALLKKSSCGFPPHKPLTFKELFDVTHNDCHVFLNWNWQWKNHLGMFPYSIIKKAVEIASTIAEVNEKDTEVYYFDNENEYGLYLSLDIKNSKVIQDVVK